MATDLLSVNPAIEPAAQRVGVARDGRGGGESNDHPAAPVTGVAHAGAGQGTVNVDDAANRSSAKASNPYRAWVNDYVQLTKPRIVVMILVTTFATALLGAGGLVSASVLFWLMLGTAAVAASAGAANQVWERTIDCRMTRTAMRPLPDGRLSVVSAAAFTATLAVAGTAVLAVKFGTVPALAGAVTWLIYVLVYTPMKTRTQWNTTVGAIAGALPVMIGYTATGGSLLDATGWLLVGVLVAWQYPHFMAIAWMYRRQYQEAGFCMTTTVEPTGRSAAIQSILGSLALMACGIALCFLPAGLPTAIGAALAVTLVCFPMFKASLRFAADPSDAAARKLLRSSLLVLPAVLLVVTLRVFW